MAKLEGCVPVAGPAGPAVCCAFLPGPVGRSCLAAVRMGSRPAGPLTMGLASGHMAWTRSCLQERGHGPHTWDGSPEWARLQPCAAAGPIHGAERVFAEGGLTERGVKGVPSAVQGPGPCRAPLCVGLASAGGLGEPSAKT